MASKARNEMQAVFSKKETRSKSVKRKAWTFGGVAQLGEHLPCKQGVRSSILLISTNFAQLHASIGFFLSLAYTYATTSEKTHYLHKSARNTE